MVPALVNEIRLLSVRKLKIMKFSANHISM